MKKGQRQRIIDRVRLDRDMEWIAALVGYYKPDLMKLEMSDPKKAELPEIIKMFAESQRVTVPEKKQ